MRTKPEARTYRGHMPKNLLEQLRKFTIVVADTGDIEAIGKFRPQDSTTNPSLITAAAQLPQYKPIVDGVLLAARKELGASATGAAVANLAFQRLAIAFGKKILAIVPGRVSTEVDARLSYDTAATIEQARSIIKKYDAEGIGRKRAGQDRFHLGGYPRRRSAGARGNSLQPDLTVWAAPGHCGRRGRRHTGLALCGPHS